MKDLEGFSLKDRMLLRVGLSIVGKRSFEVDYHPNNLLCKLVNRMASKRAGIREWHFTDVGR